MHTATLACPSLFYGVPQRRSTPKLLHDLEKIYSGRRGPDVLSFLGGANASRTLCQPSYGIQVLQGVAVLSQEVKSVGAVDYTAGIK